MACGGCMAKRAARSNKYVWTGPDGSTATYPTEMEAKAKTIRSGGSYKAVPK